MNNILKRGTVLLLAMMMIITCGAFNTAFVHADSANLKVKVVDEKGNSMVGVGIGLYVSDGDTYDEKPTATGTTNGKGVISIDAYKLGEEENDYQVRPVKTTQYPCKNPLIVHYDGLYFTEANGAPYGGEELTLTVDSGSASTPQPTPHKIKVTDGSADRTEATADTKVTITAANKEGFAFKNWTVNSTSSSVTLADANAITTTFTMPDSDVTVTANYEAKKIAGLTAESARDDYLEGETFKLKGNAVLEYEDGTTKKLNSNDVTVSPEGPLTADVKEVTVSYNKNSEIKAVVPVTVKKKVDWPVMNDLPANQPKDIWETETEKIQLIPITGYAVPGIEFVFYDVTTQDPKDKVTAVSDDEGYIKDVWLKRDHNYLIYCNSNEYHMQNRYGWVHDGKLRDIKDVTPDENDENKPYYRYNEITSFAVARDTQSTTSNYSRYTTAIPVEYNGKAMPGVKFRLVSPVETLEPTTDENGILKADLLEDVNYMVSVDSDKYSVETFPLTVKDKTEAYKLSSMVKFIKYAFDHSDCQGVGPRYNETTTPLQLVDKGTEHNNDKTITSVSGNTTISGMNFKDLYCVEKKMDTKVDGLSDGTYDVYDIEAMNPHRSEVSKLAAGDFTVTEKTRAGVKVKAVYMLGSDGKLKALSFKQTKAGDPVTFKADSIGVNNVVIQYYDSLGKYTDVMGDGAVWNKGGKTPYIAKFENTDPTKNDETIDNFMGISIDGKELVRDQDYVAKAGSVITEIRPEYMETLGAGTHTLTAYFMDGDPVSVNFTVKAAAAEGAGTGAGHSITGTTVTKVSVVKTGDSFSWAPLFMLMTAIIALAAMVVIGTKKKQQR
ncbi:MAG: hypothetical protein PUC78_06495 [Baileyella intestinalis]|uniref:InlB B-repeat-containing protein n=1 Tax=Baileyella intestinalis TaxID=2606709 RepID=UPI0023F27742|nr:hypothetical protein [Baileyella intestinalis]MDD5875511.1 hypothetical protein [Baileyella intestinalis]